MGRPPPLEGRPPPGGPPPNRGARTKKRPTPSCHSRGTLPTRRTRSAVHRDARQGSASCLFFDTGHAERRRLERRHPAARRPARRAPPRRPKTLCCFRLKENRVCVCVRREENITSWSGSLSLSLSHTEQRRPLELTIAGSTRRVFSRIRARSLSLSHAPSVCFHRWQASARTAARRAAAAGSAAACATAAATHARAGVSLGALEKRGGNQKKTRERSLDLRGKKGRARIFAGNNTAFSACAGSRGHVLSAGRALRRPTDEIDLEFR